jgi:hypothetical protein
MALNANALVTVDDLRAYLGQGVSSESETMMELLINAASQEFDRFCGRQLKQKTETNLYLDGDGTKYLYLPSCPAASVTGVYENDTLLVVDTDYLVYTSDHDAYLLKYYPTWPELTSGGFPVWAKGHKTVKISSVLLGYATVPSDIVLGCLKQCAVEYQRMKQKTWGETSRSSESQSVSVVEPGLLPDVEAVLKRYRRVAV